MLRDVKNFDKVILSKFSKQVDEVRVDEMVRLERLFARCIALKPQSEATLKPHNLKLVYKKVRLERRNVRWHSFRRATL